jgi:hypothetical protein
MVNMGSVRMADSLTSPPALAAPQVLESLRPLLVLLAPALELTNRAQQTRLLQPAQPLLALKHNGRPVIPAHTIPTTGVVSDVFCPAGYVDV